MAINNNLNLLRYKYVNNSLHNITILNDNEIKLIELYLINVTFRIDFFFYIYIIKVVAMVRLLAYKIKYSVVSII